MKLPSRMVVKLYSALVIEVTDDISQALQEVKVTLSLKWLPSYQDRPMLPL